MRPNTSTPRTVAALIDWGQAQLAAARVICGHGMASHRDEAAAIIYHVMGLEHADPAAYERCVGEPEFQRIAALLAQRVDQRMPVPYLLGEAWFAGLPYYVDERVLIPRSPFAELIAAGFAPWVGSRPGMRILEIGTGSGCIAIACALAFPASTVVASDLSWAALQVARRNVNRHDIADRVHLVQADLLRGIGARFDLIVSNPPYVCDGELAKMPTEYQREPHGALAGGPDGLALVRRILQDAPLHLEPDGWLAVEVGAGIEALERTFPAVPFVWPDLEHGGDGIALVSASDLAQVTASSGMRT
jgi:ribosomal protein L3 glutamine methyltransferase